MKRKNTLIVLCGISGSGKSTFRDLLVEKGMKCVCPDLIRKRLYGDENIQGDGKIVFSIAYDDMTIFGDAKEDVVFDATNVTKKARKEIIKRAKNSFDFILCYYLHTPLPIALQRNSKRKRQVPEDVIYSQHQRFQQPSLDEGFDYIAVIEWGFNDKKKVIDELENYYKKD